MLGRFILALLVVMLGCDRVLGIEHLEGRTGPAPVAFARAECGVCEREQCAEPARACDRDQVCVQIHRCVAACGLDDARCRSACEDAELSYRSNVRYQALDTCRRASCRAGCLGDDSLTKLLPPSCECLGKSCRPAAATCLASPPRDGLSGDCERAYVCFAGHERLDPDVIHHCTRRFSAGGAELVSFSQCMEQQSCASCPPADPFACVGKYSWRSGLALRPKLKMTVVGDEGKIVVGARVHACLGPLCGSCGHEDSSTLSTDVSNDKGEVILELAGGFTGCIHAEHPDHLHTQVIWTRPVVEDETFTGLEAIALMRPSTLDLLMATIGAKRDPDRAQALFVARDCVLGEAAGLTLEPLPDPAATVIYLRDSLPSKTPPTDKSGTAVVVNLAPGAVTFRLRTATMLVSERTFLARPDHLHDVRMLPLPR